MKGEPEEEGSCKGLVTRMGGLYREGKLGGD